MRYAQSVADLVGNTPLVRLSRVTDGIAATVLAKIEYFNPGGSAKDRIAANIVDAAERDARFSRQSSHSARQRHGQQMMSRCSAVQMTQNRRLSSAASSSLAFPVFASRRSCTNVPQSTICADAPADEGAVAPATKR